MPLGLGPRFVVEAAFLIAVAVAAGMLSLTTPAIVGVMAGAWLLVAAVEWGLSRRAARASEREPAAPIPSVREPSRRVEAPREPAPEPEPLPEPVAPEPVEALPAADPLEALPDGAPPPLPEPLPPASEPAETRPPGETEKPTETREPPAERERPELAVVPEPEPEAEPEPEPAREPQVAEVVRLPAAGDSREWNLWDLERATRAVSGDDPARDEERAFLLMYLRDFAGPDGSLPERFDGLVRDSFGDVLGSGAR